MTVNIDFDLKRNFAFGCAYDLEGQRSFSFVEYFRQDGKTLDMRRTRYLIDGRRVTKEAFVAAGGM